MTAMTCTKCGKQFECPKDHPEAHECFSCNYGTAMDEAAQRFSPLSEPLARLLETRLHVDQTGGMIMCLAVTLPNGFYAWFSELDSHPDEQLAGFGLYYWDEATDTDGGGFRFAVPPAGFEWSPTNGQAMAEWAAPLLTQAAVEATEGRTIRTMTVGDFQEL